MANPVMTIGPRRSARYTVDWGPMQRDRALALEGMMKFGDIGHKASLGELMKAGYDHREFVSRAAKKGIPMRLISEALTLRQPWRRSAGG